MKCAQKKLHYNTALIFLQDKQVATNLYVQGAGIIEVLNINMYNKKEHGHLPTIGLGELRIATMGSV